MNANLQVSFLPWAGFEKSIKLGPIIFWPYYIEAEQKISDPEVKTYLDRYFKSYVDHLGKPVDTITVCSHERVNFHSLNDLERRDIRSAVDALIFAAIVPQAKRAVCANNDSLAPPTADVFELLYQDFRPGNDRISVQAGSNITIGVAIGRTRFPKPWATGGTLWSIEEKLVRAFDKCFSPEFLVDVRERLFRSLEWFRMAHMEGGQVSDLTKLVMMAIAFEILLQFPTTRGKRKYFVDYMENHIASDDFFKDNRITRNGKSFNQSLAGCWAWDFYELRSRVVHGDTVPSGDLIYQDWITHLIVADLVYWECLKRELFIHKCLGDNVYSSAKEFDKAFPDEPQGGAVEPLARWFLGFNDVHRALGWIHERGAHRSSENTISGSAAPADHST